MKEETRNCQNCKQDFKIEEEDFNFYEKIKVPPPTWCPECRMIRRFMWRNERNLYKDVCGLCKKNMVSVYAPENSYTVYCPDCWKGDGWDAMEYGQDYDFSKPFFEQYKELMKKVPRSALHQTNVLNSPYANYSQDVKNVYLSYSAVYECENIYYSKFIDHSKNIFESYDLSFSEQCYENVSGEKNYNTQFAYFCRSAIDSKFVYDCWNISNCFLCTNLRNQKYCYKNKPYSKEDYLEIVNGYKLNTIEGLARAKKEFEEIYKEALHRFAHTSNTINSTGENMRNCKNIKNSFYVTDCENSKFIFRSPGIKDSMDASHVGNAEQIYEYMNGGAHGSQLIKFCINLKPGNSNVEYSDYCGSVSDVFGSIGVKNRQYVILNKQYSKEEYDLLLEKIKKHMIEMPYSDRQGRIYKYGEFFPEELAPFAYNETIAQEHFPKTKKEIQGIGSRYREREERQVNNQENSVVQLCDNNGIQDNLCTMGFKILPEEVNFYTKINLPIPTKCPNCRYFERNKFINPLKLWNRSCMCTKENHNHAGKCKVEFETSYAPDRPEIVYCEKCYQQEVY